MDDFRRQCFLEGLDQIALTLQNEDKILAFEKKRELELH
jgi:3-isopropylmalate dehydratase small subunit